MEAACIAQGVAEGLLKASGSYWSPEMLSGQDHLGGNSLTSPAKRKVSSLEVGRGAGAIAVLGPLQAPVQHTHPASRAASALGHRGEMSRCLLHGVTVNKATSLPLRCDMWKQRMEGTGQEGKGIS